MGTRSVVGCLALAAVITACGEQQQPESVAGPSLAGQTNPALCNPNSLNSLISGYFPGSSGNVIKAYKDAMVAAPKTTTARDNGFAILDSIGSLSRRITVDGAAGSLLTQGVIACMFDATKFTPTFPSDPIYNFAPALASSAGGGFYTRGAGTGSAGPVIGALTEADPVDILSGVNPLSGTWTTTLSSNAGSEGRALIYGYRVGTTDPLVYEWATIPPAATFTPAALVAICDGANADASMIHESNIGVLAYSSASPICAANPLPVVLKETGWGPRALAARLARAVVSAVQPEPLQAAVIRTTGTGGTPTTFKSQFKKKTVTNVTLAFAPDPPSVLNVKNMPYVVRVRVTSDIDEPTKGTNGVCVFLTGSTNNGTNTALDGNHECDEQPGRGQVSAITKSILIGNPAVLTAGYAEFNLSVTKTGGLTITASSTDGANVTGVVGRDGQIFTGDIARTNVKP